MSGRGEEGGVTVDGQIARRLAKHYPVGLARETKICNACEATWPCDVAVALQWVNPAAEEIAALRDKAALWDALLASGGAA